MLVRSRYIEKIRPFVGLDVVKVITGIRRSGKSVLLQQIQDEIAQNVDPAGVFVRINLEEEENSRFLSKGVVHAHVLNIAKKSRDRKVYVFLDVEGALRRPKAVQQATQVFVLNAFTAQNRRGELAHRPG